MSAVCLQYEGISISLSLNLMRKKNYEKHLLYDHWFEAMFPKLAITKFSIRIKLHFGPETVMKNIRSSCI